MEDEGIITMQASNSAGFGNSKETMANAGYQQQAQFVAPQEPRRWHARVAQKLERWLFLYNVTTGLYMLDWWERCLVNTAFVVFVVVVGYNGGPYLQRKGAGFLTWAWCGDSSPIDPLAAADS